jgi:threonine dehydrogenase-like Zn-dependent dehydrogenase
MRPILGKRIHVGGFDASMVCAANRAAVDDALRFTRSRGSVYLVANVAKLPGVDWTPLWMKELSVRGSVGYQEPLHDGVPRKTFAKGLSLLTEGWGDKVGALVTHRKPLREFEPALAICFGRERTNAIKVAFDFRG